MKAIGNKARCHTADLSVRDPEHFHLLLPSRVYLLLKARLHSRLKPPSNSSFTVPVGPLRCQRANNFHHPTRGSRRIVVLFPVAEKNTLASDSILPLSRKSD